MPNVFLWMQPEREHGPRPGLPVTATAVSETDTGEVGSSSVSRCLSPPGESRKYRRSRKDDCRTESGDTGTDYNDGTFVRRQGPIVPAADGGGWLLFERGCRPVSGSVIKISAFV